MSVVTGDNYDGEASLILMDVRSKYEKVNSAVGLSPFETSLSLNIDAAMFTDTDGVCYQSSFPDSCDGITINAISGTEQRYGRIAMRNTYGPENRPLRVPLVAEYVVNGNWVVNTQDNCSQ